MSFPDSYPWVHPPPGTTWNIVTPTCFYFGGNRPNFVPTAARLDPPTIPTPSVDPLPPQSFDMSGTTLATVLALRKPR